MSVTIISVNRYFLIVRPNESATFFSLRRTKIMLFTLWFLAVFIAIPPNLGWGHYGFFVSRATCFIAVGSSYSYTSFLVIAFIAAPFSVLIWCYMKIYLAMKKSKRRVVQISVRNLAGSMSAENKERLKKEVRTFNLLFSFRPDETFKVITLPKALNTSKTTFGALKPTSKMYFD